ARHLHLDDVAVALQQGAFAAAATHQLDQLMGAQGRARLARGQELNRLKHAGQCDIAFRSHTGAVDVEAPAGNTPSLAFYDPIAVQVRLLPDTAGCAYLFDQTGSDRAAVETIQTPLTDGAQGGGQLRLTNQLAGRRSLIVPEKDTRRFRILLHGLQAETDQGAVTLAHRKTFLGGGHRRRQALL